MNYKEKEAEDDGEDDGGADDVVVGD